MMDERMFWGYTCFGATALFWGLAYLGMIWRGFAGRTYGMPLPALAANLAWEFTIAFV